MTSDVSEVLAPCPFCNGASHVSRESSFDGWTAKCSNCGIVGAEFGQASNAIAAWNTRAQPAVLAVPDGKRERIAFYEQAMKDPKNHGALALEMAFLRHQADTATQPALPDAVLDSQKGGVK